MWLRPSGAQGEQKGIFSSLEPLVTESDLMRQEGPRRPVMDRDQYFVVLHKHG
jgi:hypothetical protein